MVDIQAARAAEAARPHVEQAARRAQDVADMAREKAQRGAHAASDHPQVLIEVA